MTKRIKIALICVMLSSLSLWSQEQFQSISGTVLIDDFETSVVNVTVQVSFKKLRKVFTTKTDTFGRFYFNNTPLEDEFYFKATSKDKKVAPYRSKIYQTTEVRNAVVALKLLMKPTRFELKQRKELRRKLREENKEVQVLEPEKERQEVIIKKIKNLQILELNTKNKVAQIQPNWAQYSKDLPFHRIDPIGVSFRGEIPNSSSSFRANSLRLNWNQGNQVGYSLDGELEVPLGMISRIELETLWSDIAPTTANYSLILNPFTKFLSINGYAIASYSPIKKIETENSFYNERSLSYNLTSGIAVSGMYTDGWFFKGGVELVRSQTTLTPSSQNLDRTDKLYDLIWELSSLTEETDFGNLEHQSTTAKLMYENLWYMNENNTIGFNVLGSYREEKKLDDLGNNIQSTTSNISQDQFGYLINLFMNNTFKGFKNRIDIGVSGNQMDRPQQNLNSTLIIQDDNDIIQLGANPKQLQKRDEQGFYFQTKLETILDNQVLEWMFRYDYYKQSYLGMDNAYGTFYYKSIQEVLEGKNASFFDLNFVPIDRNITKENKNKVELSHSEFNTSITDEFLLTEERMIKVGLGVYLPLYNTKKATNTYFENQKSNLTKSAEDYSTGTAPSLGVYFNPFAQLHWNVDNEDKIKVLLRAGINTEPLRKDWMVSLQANSVRKKGTFVEETPTYYDPLIWVENFQYIVTEPLNQGSWAMVSEDFKLNQNMSLEFRLDYRSSEQLDLRANVYFTKYLNHYQLENLNGFFNYYKIDSLNPVLSYSKYDENLRQIVGLSNKNRGGYGYGLNAGVDYRPINPLKFRLDLTYSDTKNFADFTQPDLIQQFQNYFVQSETEKASSTYSMGYKIDLKAEYALVQANSFDLRVGLQYVRQSGRAFTFTYDGLTPQLERDNIHRSSLFYVPKKVEDVRLIPYQNHSGTVSVETQRERLESFLNANDYLTENRGNFVKRNETRLPDQNLLNIQLNSKINLTHSQYLDFQLGLENGLSLLSDELAATYYLPTSSIPVLHYEGTETKDGSSEQKFSFRKIETEKLGKNAYLENLTTNGLRIWLGVSYHF